MIKKLLLKAIMFGFVMLGLSTYAGYLMTGHMPSYMSGIKNFLPGRQSLSVVVPNWGDIGRLEHKGVAQAENYEVMQGGKTVIYKWRDANGHWQYGERAPAQGSVIKMEVATAPSASASSRTESVPVSEGHSGLMNPYSPEGVKQLTDKAHEIQRMMNQRNDHLSRE